MTPTQAAHRRLADDADARALTAHHPTRDATLALYGTRHHSRAYHATRSIIRAALCIIPFTLAFIHAITF